MRDGVLDERLKKHAGHERVQQIRCDRDVQIDVAAISDTLDVDIVAHEVDLDRKTYLV